MCFTPPTTVCHLAVDRTLASIIAPLTFSASSTESLITPSTVLGNIEEVSARGLSVMAFCKTITMPGLQDISRNVRSLSLVLEDIRPSSDDLTVIAQALEALTHLEQLTLLGLPFPDSDGLVLRNTSFSLRKFVSDLSLCSKDVLEFLARQTCLVELGTTSSLPTAWSRAPIRCQPQYRILPNELIPDLKVLDCPASLLLSMLLASPPTRTITNLRVDLNRASSLLETDALVALASFSPTLKRLSLRRDMVGSGARRSRAMRSMADVLDRIGEKRRWTALKFLELEDGPYDLTSVPALQQSISTYFPNIETLVWAPSRPAEHAEASNVLEPEYIASIFFMFCPSLRQFIFSEPESEDGEKTYTSFSRLRSKDMHPEGILDSAEVENMWRET
ncbi:hypothetical protein A0H81_09945 [Grifola frondosa]|uniref:F-box domain-containing protein n=1 Tax=Grifola frondosa TaxID=5627 RepID=A0A1C7LZQ5_GRIFR|nr:hypothetical protein A0H81_09945 [Grifola frondosa]